MTTSKENPAGQGGAPKADEAGASIGSEPTTAKSLLQSHRAEIEFYLQRTAFADLLPDERAKAAMLFIGLGAALDDLGTKSDLLPSEFAADGSLGLLALIGKEAHDE